MKAPEKKIATTIDRSNDSWLATKKAAKKTSALSRKLFRFRR
jgi:hypothetical protein